MCLYLFFFVTELSDDSDQYPFIMAGASLLALLLALSPHSLPHTIFTHFITQSRAYSLTLTHSRIHSLAHSHSQPFIHSLTLTNSFTHTHSFTRTQSLTFSLTRVLSHTLIHSHSQSLTHSRTHLLTLKTLLYYVYY
jgi:hypothetical protein